jgi:hypothetical protein
VTVSWILGISQPGGGFAIPQQLRITHRLNGPFEILKCERGLGAHPCTSETKDYFPQIANILLDKSGIQVL